MFGHKNETFELMIVFQMAVCLVIIIKFVLIFCIMMYSTKYKGKSNCN